ncbi:hypothetical protein PRZ48_011572 [Zasmidium cellare]|uniref:ASST-domain-containing protein n=1 Tax=Zasmidium cellare TaxID=395010 RepID=A0ABR0E6R5_ZASCE|nr:hypothetical protein PRZ48_011572 [Zasmidium cellare]
MLSYLITLILTSRTLASPIANGPPSYGGGSSWQGSPSGSSQPWQSSSPWSGSPSGHGSPPCYGSQCSSNGSSTCNSQSSSDPGPGIEHHDVTQAGGYLWPYQVYKSSPLTPPEWQINSTGAELAPGLIFLTISDTLPLNTTKRPSPKIFTDKGQLVWSGPRGNSTNLKFQEYNGKPTLTYWSGDTTSGTNVGHGYGNITFLDETYKTGPVVCPNYPSLNYSTDGTFKCDADIHESFITDRNTLLSSAYNATPADLSSQGGPKDGWAWSSQFYELDPATGDVLFRWDSLEHAPINESHLPLNVSAGDGNFSAPYDYFHINSVVNIGDYYLLNSRHLWTTYLLAKNGSIIWSFSGDTGGDFGPLPDNGHFRWEHFVRPHNVTNTTLEISMFDNANYAPDQDQPPIPTDLLVYRLPLHPAPNDGNTSQAELISRIQTQEDLVSDSQGSYQPRLENGNQFACYGQLPRMLEFDPAGHTIWEGRIAPDNLAQVYRAYKLTGWHATPSDLPGLFVERVNETWYSSSSSWPGHSGDQRGAQNAYYGYASWNGATDVTGWNVYVGSSEGNLTMTGTTGYRGFETQFNVPCWAKFVQVGAVEKNGTEVRKSDVFTVE